MVRSSPSSTRMDSPPREKVLITPRRATIGEVCSRVVCLSESFGESAFAGSDLGDSLALPSEALGVSLAWLASVILLSLSLSDRWRACQADRARRACLRLDHQAEQLRRRLFL